MPAETITSYLDEHEVEYSLVEHSPAYTAQEVAASAHFPGRGLAKTVMIKIDGEMAMAVLPAAYRVNFDRLGETLGASTVELASESEFKDLFPDCDVGAMPPFGNLYDLQVIVDESLSGRVIIAFCAGTHTELIQLRYSDFETLVEPKVLDFSLRP